MNALALVQEAVERFVPIEGHLDKISMSLEELHDFVYIWGIDRNQISKDFLVTHFSRKLSLFGKSTFREVELFRESIFSKSFIFGNSVWDNHVFVFQ